MDRPGIPAGIPTFNLVFNAIQKLQKEFWAFRDETNNRLSKLEQPVLNKPNILEKKETIKEEKKVKK